MNTITLSSFWQFSLTLYKNDLVQTTLLHFQNEYTANVNLALLCAMLNKHQVSLSKSQLISLHQSITDFSAQYTQPLRALRQTYKNNKDEIQQYAQLRAKLLEAELLLEQQEQALLISQLNKINVVEKQQSDNLTLYQSLVVQPNKPSLAMKLSDLNQFLL
jgi:uncharacterized protein (TIGR02444 family)